MVLKPERLAGPVLKRALGKEGSISFLKKRNKKLFSRG
jgi:hypothetical protein